MGLGYWIRSSAGALLIASAGGAFADQGAELYRQKMCANCHGSEGSYALIPGYPALGGQSATYLLRQMKDIRDGRRDNGHSEIMRSAVAEVTDEEFEQIAAWLASRW